MISFPPTRATALQRLSDFVPLAGAAYANGRNTDFGPDQPNAVSRLSPYLRYRVITEDEATRAVLHQHSLENSEKFIQEVLWRTYFKGWLEMRPNIWHRFCEERDSARATCPDRTAVMTAEQGETGIEGFDDWARELVETGYLHNHARMWFASIWIFTLRLPWTLGADFFLRHLIDADPASNTLSWRWVAGLQTPGKTYLATRDNIARYTNGRFAPDGLAREAVALTEPPIPSPVSLAAPPNYDHDRTSVWLVTHEDLHIESIMQRDDRVSSILILQDDNWLWGDRARQFVDAAIADTAQRLTAAYPCPVTRITQDHVAHIAEAAKTAGTSQILTAYAPIGPVADALRKLKGELARHNISLTEVRRAWDDTFWPDATRGFFNFKQSMPAHLRDLGVISHSAEDLPLFRNENFKSERESSKT